MEALETCDVEGEETIDIDTPLKSFPGLRIEDKPLSILVSKFKFFYMNLLGPLNKNFLASHMSINFEPFRRTDISMNPLGPTNYTSSNTERYNLHYAKCALPSKAQASSRAAIMEILAM
jgi:hypothetical protein